MASDDNNNDENGYDKDDTSYNDDDCGNKINFETNNQNMLSDDEDECGKSQNNYRNDQRKQI